MVEKQMKQTLFTTTTSMQQTKKKSTMSVVTTAFVGGMSGGILSSCLSNGIASKVLIYASRRIPDPEGAAIIIEFLGTIADNTSLKIDTAELRKQGAALKPRLER